MIDYGKIRRTITAMFFIGSMVETNVASAAMCVDSVTEVIAHSSGKIYFTTANACSVSWCELSGSNAFIRNGYAILVAAKVANTPVILQWDQLANCSEKSKIYSVPNFIVLR